MYKINQNNVNITNFNGDDTNAIDDVITQDDEN